MEIKIRVSTIAGISWKKPALCRIEIRDTSLADAKAKIIETHESFIESLSESMPHEATIDIHEEPGTSGSLTVWVHVSPTSDRRIQKGDLVTTSSFPILKDYSSDYINVWVNLV